MTDQTMPGANTTIQWFADRFPGSRFNANCGCLHTTEGTSWPGYEGGAVAPNATARPSFAKQRLHWRQHFPVDMSSRALRNQAGGVETNTLNVFQIELVGTCDGDDRGRTSTRTTWRRRGLVQDKDFIYWPEAPDWALAGLARMMAWLNVEHGIPLASPRQGRWKPYPASFGPGGNRLSRTDWHQLHGWIGHQHVPENVHGDPGDLDFAHVLRLAERRLGPDKPRPPKPDGARPKTVLTKASAKNAMVFYRTPRKPQAFELSGGSLVLVSQIRADALRASGLVVRVVTIPARDPIWQLPRSGGG